MWQAVLRCAAALCRDAPSCDALRCTVLCLTCPTLRHGSGASSRAVVNECQPSPLCCHPFPRDRSCLCWLRLWKSCRAAPTTCRPAPRPASTTPRPGASRTCSRGLARAGSSCHRTEAGTVAVSKRNVCYLLPPLFPSHAISRNPQFQLRSVPNQPTLTRHCIPLL